MNRLTNKNYKLCREAVERGIALLDRRRPRWFEQIDLEAFDLTEGKYCICGQLGQISRSLNGDAKRWWPYTGYLKVLLGRDAPFAERTIFAERHGFEPPAEIQDENWDNTDVAWAYMERLWRQAIKERRAAAAVAA